MTDKCYGMCNKVLPCASDCICPCHKSADNTAERHAIGHILRQPPKEEPKLEFPTDTAGKKDHDACLFRGVCDCPTDTSEEWKRKIWQFFNDNNLAVHSDWVVKLLEVIEKELLTARTEGQINAGFDAAKLKQRSFEEGMKRRDNEAQLNFEAGHAAGFEEGYKKGHEEKPISAFASGYAAALSKVKDMLFTDDPECEHGFNPAELCKNVHCEIRFRRDLLDHLKTIE